MYRERCKEREIGLYFSPPMWKCSEDTQVTSVYSSNNHYSFCLTHELHHAYHLPLIFLVIFILKINAVFSPIQMTARFFKENV